MVVDSLTLVNDDLDVDCRLSGVIFGGELIESPHLHYKKEITRALHIPGRRAPYILGPRLEHAEEVEFNRDHYLRVVSGDSYWQFAIKRSSGHADLSPRLFAHLFEGQFTFGYLDMSDFEIYPDESKHEFGQPLEEGVTELLGKIGSLLSGGRGAAGYRCEPFTNK